MKIRIYSPFLPYPVTEGAFQLIFEQVLGFAKYHSVELVCWKDSFESLQSKIGDSKTGRPGIDDQFAKIFGPSVRLIHWPAKESQESGLMRMNRLLRSLPSLDASPGLYYYPPERDQREELGPCDLAIYHYTFAWSWLRHRKQLEEQKTVIHWHNIESDQFEYRARQERVFALAGIHRWNAMKLARQESELEQLVDEFWMISPKDLIDLRERGSGKSASLRTPCYRAENLTQRRRAFEKHYLAVAKNLSADGHPTIGFIGGLDFEPNRMSLEWILDRVCPLLKNENFTGILKVVGKNAPPDLRDKMARFSFVNYVGFLPRLDPFWDELSLMLVPHITGSGVRIKLLDSIASGVPALANDAAIERIHPDLRNSPFLSVADDPKDWAKLILRLKGQSLRAHLQERGMDKAFEFAAIYPTFAVE
ncbi:MAG: hypothetical protein C5B49_05220 [Bdellovibrio sp.]|nr:MAG: hypothetical protein C5B49_05220 [Bdellovibrio sp.]